MRLVHVAMAPFRTRIDRTRGETASARAMMDRVRAVVCAIRAFALSVGPSVTWVGAKIDRVCVVMARVRGSLHANRPSSVGDRAWTHTGGA